MFFYSASGHGRHTGINMQRHAKTAKVVKLMNTDANDGGHQYQPMIEF